MSTHHNTKRGSIVVFTLIIMAIVLAGSLAIAQSTLSGRRAANATAASVSALQHADSGVEIFLQQLYRESPDWSGPSNLVKLANKITEAMKNVSGETYECTNGRISIEGDDKDISWVFYRKNLADGKTERIESCTVSIHDISEFQVIGEDRGTARAFSVNLRDPIDRGLLAHWDFEDNITAGGNGSPVAKDRSRSHRALMALCPDGQNDGNGGIDKSPCYENLSAGDPDMMKHETSWGDGIIGDGSIKFNGSSHHLMLVPRKNETGENVFDYVEDFDGDKPFSFAGWVRAEDVGQIQMIISRREKEDDYRGYELRINPQRQLVFIYANHFRSSTDYEMLRVGTDEQLNYGQWHHVAMVYAGGKKATDVKLYIDGELATKDTSLTRSPVTGSVKPSAETPLVVGARWDPDEPSSRYNTNWHFKGFMDDLRIYGRELTNSEVEYLYRRKDSYDGGS